MPAEVEPSVVRSYIKPQLLSQLREIQASNWDTTKLIALIEEFDACVHAGHTYAPHALLRTLLDHVPPLFGQKNFAAVVSNHSWGHTDSRYMKKLHAFRDQADDALHRQISHKPDPLMHDDLPPRAAVNALLGACIEQLQKP
jgi:hypothetical protein